MVDGGQWEQKSFGQLASIPSLGREARKNIFLWDKQGSVGTYFQYRGSLCQLAPEIIKKTLGQQDAAGVQEVLRAHLVNAMRNGEDTLIDLDKTAPDFNGEMTSSDVFDAALVFNYEEWAKEENYIRFVKENENHGIGGLNPGHYIRSPDF